MSLQKNVANQKITFVLINATTGAAITGAAASIVGYITGDGGSQASCSGTFTEIGLGMYSYAPTQAETNFNHIGIFITAPTVSALPMNLPFWTTGFHRASATQQYITFGMISVSGVADGSASPTLSVSKDAGSITTGGGTTSNLGNGQFRYAPTTGSGNETDGVNVSYLATASNDFPVDTSLFTVTP